MTLTEKIEALRGALDDVPYGAFCDAYLNSDTLADDVRKLEQERDRLHVDALGHLAKAGIATPEEGYLKAPHCLGSNIDDLARERDEARQMLREACEAAEEKTARWNAALAGYTQAMAAALADEKSLRAALQATVDALGKLIHVLHADSGGDTGVADGRIALALAAADEVLF